MGLHASGVIVMMTLIGGGFVSFWGPVHRCLGSISWPATVLGTVTETWLLWFGLVFMLVVLFKPEGIAGAWREHVGSRERRVLAWRTVAGFFSWTRK